MGAITLEERLSIVEADLAALKRFFEPPPPLVPKKAGVLDAALAKIWEETPDDAWDEFPADFGDNLDHYLYGTQKQ